MNLLLDTHIILWYSQENDRLSSNVRSLIDSRDNKCFVSMATQWEIAIKRSVNKLEDDMNVRVMRAFVEYCGFQWLDIKNNHLDVVEALPFYHRDPFDRMLVAQAIAERMDIVSVDAMLDPYLQTQSRRYLALSTWPKSA